MSQSLLLQVFIHTSDNVELRFGNQVAIPSITGLHSYTKTMRMKVLLYNVAIPSITGLHSYGIAVQSIKRHRRNPFYYRSSFIRKWRSFAVITFKSQSLLLQVFIHTIKKLPIPAKQSLSQSLLLQVFIHT